MEGSYRCGCCDVVVGHPHVLTYVVALPFDEVFDATISKAAVQYAFYFVLAFAVYENRIGGGAARRPGNGSAGAGVSFTIENTGWRRRREIGRRRR